MPYSSRSRLSPARTAGKSVVTKGPGRQGLVPTLASSASTLMRGVAAGFLGTSAMTLSAAAQRRWRPNHPVDYDAGEAPVVAAAKVLRYQPKTPGERRAMFALVHWGYGSLVGVGQLALLRGLRREPAATAVFFLSVEAMALTLLPTLGDTPPVGQWPADVLGLSLVQHGVYAAGTGVAAHLLASR